MLRGDYSLITVPVAAGAKTVELTFRSKAYEVGRAITLVSSVVLLIALLLYLAAIRLRHG